MKEYRSEYISRYNKDYFDLDWQLHFIVRCFLGEMNSGDWISTCFEMCYEDRNEDNDESFDDYFTKFRG